MANLENNIARLCRASQHPREQLDYYLAQGKKVVGCFPAYTPEELVYASGMIPMGMWGGQVELKQVKQFLPAFACPIMQANLELGLNGDYEGVSAVIIPALCDTLRCMTQNWKYGVESIPMIPIVYPQNRKSPASTDYLIGEFESVLVALNLVTGQALNEKALQEALEVYNRHSEVMAEFAKVANHHLDVVTPSVRHQIMKSGFFFDKREHTAIMEEIIAQLKERPQFQFTGKKVVLCGILCEPLEILEGLEAYTVAVVGDDLAQESRQYRGQSPSGGGGLKRLALQWNQRYGCSLIHELGKPRGEMLVDLCRETGADGVISCMMKFCDPEEYDQPHYEGDLSRADIPTMAVEIDPVNPNLEQIRTRIQSFCEML